MHSRGHREAILQPAYRDVGVGIVVGAAPRAKPVSRSAVTYTTDFGG